MSNIGKLVIVAACIAVGALVAMRLSSRSTTRELSDAQPPGPKALVRITPQRIPLPEQVAFDCISLAGVYGPHFHAAEVHIYANETVLNFRREHPHEFDYPIGSKFVKEKYSHIGDANADAATIMERRSATGDVSDWAFSIKPLAKGISLAPINQESCARCHAGFDSTGYISTESDRALRKYLKIE